MIFLILKGEAILSRKNSEAWNSIHTICQMKNFDEEALYKKTKLLLETYRKVCWTTTASAMNVADEIMDYCATDLDGALIYLETFAPDRTRDRFEQRINSLFQTKWMLELFETAMLQIREYPGKGELYHNIIHDCYLSRYKYTQSELMEQFHIERSCFYDRKKEAIMMFGISMWGTAIPNLRGLVKSEESMRNIFDISDLGEESKASKADLMELF